MSYQMIYRDFIKEGSLPLCSYFTGNSENWKCKQTDSVTI